MPRLALASHFPSSVLASLLCLFLPLAGKAQCPDAKPLQVHALLAGAFEVNGMEPIMQDSLRVHGLIPLTEPYSALGYVHVGGGGGEMMHASLLSITGPNAIVDWVVVELRHPNNPGKRIATKSALLQRSGDVLGANGQPLSFCVPIGRYQVALRHRNHLGVITQRSVLLDGSLAEANFRDAQAPDNTRGGMEALQVLNEDSTLFALWPGDVSFDGRLKYVGEENDRDPILQSIGGSVPTNVLHNVYAQPDVNLDSRVQYVGEHNDRDPVLLAIGGNTPTNMREDFIPDDTLRMRPNVHVLDATTWHLDEAQSDLDSLSTMVFDVEGNIPLIEEGHVIAGSFLGGFIRTVDGIQVTGSHIVINSSPRWLDALYESGTLSYETNFDLEDVSNFGPLSLAMPSGIGLTGGLLDMGVNLDASFYCEHTFTPSGEPITHLGVRTSASMNGRFVLSGTFNYSYDFPPILLGTVPTFVTIPLVPPAVLILPFPIVVTLESSVGGSVGAQIPTSDYLWNFGTPQLRAGVRKGEETGISTEISMQPFSGGIDPVGAPGHPSTNLGISVGASIRSQIYMLNAPVGPYAELGVEFGITGATSSEEDWHIEISSPIKYKLGFGSATWVPEAVTGLNYEFNPLTLWTVKSPGYISFVSDSLNIGQPNAQLDPPVRAHVRTTVSALGSDPVPVGPGVPGVRATFQVLTGQGTVSEAHVWSDSNGEATTTWTLGSGQAAANDQVLRVSAKDGAGASLQNSPDIIRASTNIALRLQDYGGSYQQGIPNTNLPGGLFIRVVTNDQLETPVPNITVDFDLVSGGGEILIPEVITDADGYGVCYWSLGTYAEGGQEVAATLLDSEGNHVEGSPIHFYASFRPLRILEVSGNEQFGGPNSVLDDEIIVRVVSDFGFPDPNPAIPIAGVPVQFEVHGGGQVYPVEVISDESGYASAAWSLGSCADGPQQVTLSAITPGDVTVEPVDFEFTATMDPTDGPFSCGAYDIDGNYYPTVVIGTKNWFTENLRVTRYSNGDTIQPGSGVAWNTATEGMYAPGSFGNYYNRLAAFDPRGLCPTGWHVSTYADWLEMLQIAGTEDGGSGEPLRSQTGWSNPTPNGTNSSGFKGYPSGIITFNGVLAFLGTHAYYMTSTMGDYGYPWTFILSGGIDSSDGIGSFHGMACRCVED